MQAEELRALQAPLKQRYREQPQAAMMTLSAHGNLDEGMTCSVETGKALVHAGLHPATGGDGMAACSGDMLLQALVACAGVTLRAVATALGVPVHGGTVSAEGDLDFRGTLGVSRETPVGFADIRYDAMGNLIANFGSNSSGRSLLFVSHAMNQPPSTMKNPYAGEIVDGKAFDLPGECVLGKGASEQKSNIAAMLHAMETVIAAQRDKTTRVEQFDEPIEHAARLQAAIDVVADENHGATTRRR